MLSPEMVLELAAKGERVVGDPDCASKALASDETDIGIVVALVVDSILSCLVFLWIG